MQGSARGGRRVLSRKWNPPSTLRSASAALTVWPCRGPAKLAGPQRPFLPPTGGASTALSSRVRSPGCGRFEFEVMISWPAGAKAQSSATPWKRVHRRRHNNW